MGHNMDYEQKGQLLRRTIWTVDKKGKCCGAQYGLWTKRANTVGHNMDCGQKDTCCGAKYGLWTKRANAVGHNMDCGHKGHLLWCTIWTVDRSDTCFGSQNRLWTNRAPAVGHNMNCG